MKSFKNKLSSPKGFTLIELLIVIGIMGILATVVLAAIDPIKKLGQAKDATIKVQLSQIANAMRTYYTSKAITGAAAYPDTVAWLANPLVKELQQEPKIEGTTSYTVVQPGSGCASNHCPNIAVYGTLNVPITPGSVWCWISTTGNIGETTVANCKP